jgi:hypothetical protein
LKKLKSFREISDAAKKEWEGIEPGWHPDNLAAPPSLVDQIAEAVAERIARPPATPQP